MERDGEEKVGAAAKSKGVVDRSVGNPAYYTRWLIRQDTYAPKLFDSENNNKIIPWKGIEIKEKFTPRTMPRPPYQDVSYTHFTVLLWSCLPPDCMS